jgi:hypothetical protein
MSEVSERSEWNGRKFMQKKILARPYRVRGMLSVCLSVCSSFRPSVNYFYNCPSFVNLKGSIILQHFAHRTLHMMNKEIAHGTVCFFHPKKHSYLIIKVEMQYL